MGKLTLALLSVLGVVTSDSTTARHLATNERPIIGQAEVGRGSPSTNSLSFDLSPLTGKVGWGFFAQTAALRWSPNRNLAAIGVDPGVMVTAYDPQSRSFGDPVLIAGVFARGRKPYRLVPGSTTLDLAWSPDGGSLLFELDARRGIERINLKSGARRIIVPAIQLGKDEFGNTFGVDWSSDGGWIAFATRGTDSAPRGGFDPELGDSSDSGVHCDLWLARTDGTGRRRLGHGSGPRFSRDGRWLLARDRLETEFGVGIRIYDLQSRPVTSRWLARPALAACFSRAGKEIAVVMADGRLVLMDLSGNTKRIITSLREPILRKLQAAPFTHGPEMAVLRRVQIDW